jgi:hypothetical protein
MLPQYKPSLSDTVQLSTGKNLHFYFDHANHAGFDPTDHKLAADWHNRQAKAHTKDYRAARFHFAQRDLHELAAQGKSTKISHVPSEAVLNTLPTQNKDFWKNKAKSTAEMNEKLKTLEPFRMAAVLSGKEQPSEPVDHVGSIFGAAKKKTLAKSKSVDMQLSKKIEMDRNPPPAPLVAEETENSINPEYKELLSLTLAKRRAQRHGEANPNNVQGGEGDPRKLISPEQLDSIREAISRRNRGG